MTRKPSYQGLIEEQWIGVDPAKMALSLLNGFGREAAAECLLRAYLAEHWGAPEGTDFWLDVFRRVRLCAAAQLDPGRS